VDELVAAFERLISPEAVAYALDDRLARLELRQLQLRALDTRIFNLSAGEQIAQTWRVESGDASLVPVGADVTQLHYRFASPGAPPVVLRHDFPFPIQPADLHRLSLAIKSDDSWNRLTATLDVAGRRWETERRWDLAQHRAQSIFFQPPTFDDETFQPKVWVKLRDTGPSPAGFGENGHATLRLILSPASTFEAALARIERNFGRALDYMPFWTYVRNSLILVALTTLGTLFSSTFVAYALARLHWPGRNVAMLVMLATIMLPAQVTMIPTFVIWRQLGWYNTLNPLWVPAFFGGAFFIFLMTQAMKTLPRELEESARIDGLNHVQTWYYIILPQVKPIMAAIAIMTFMWSWNEFMGPLIYLRDQSKFPLSLGLFTLRIDSFGDWTMIMAGNVLMTLPVVVMFFVFQRYFVQGMTMSGIKG
jgi:multiple sugar transport system permease protein